MVTFYAWQTPVGVHVVGSVPVFAGCCRAMFLAVMTRERSSEAPEVGSISGESRVSGGETTPHPPGPADSSPVADILRYQLSRATVSVHP